MTASTEVRVTAEIVAGRDHWRRVAERMTANLASQVTAEGDARLLGGAA